MEDEEYVGLGAQKPPLRGCGRAVSTTPGRSGVTAPCGTPRGEAPLLVVASLDGGDEVDATTVSFLLRENLELQKEEEKERRRTREEADYDAHMQELDRRVQADVPLTPAESRAWRKWAGHFPLPTRSKEKEEEEKTSSVCSSSTRLSTSL